MLIASGMTTKQIAFDLDVSIKTIEAHRAEISRRVGVRGNDALAEFARRTGLMDHE